MGVSALSTIPNLDSGHIEVAISVSISRQWQCIPRLVMGGRSHLPEINPRYLSPEEFEPFKSPRGALVADSAGGHPANRPLACQSVILYWLMTVDVSLSCLELSSALIG